MLPIYNNTSSQSTNTYNCQLASMLSEMLMPKVIIMLNLFSISQKYISIKYCEIPNKVLY